MRETTHVLAATGRGGRGGGGGTRLSELAPHGVVLPVVAVQQRLVGFFLLVLQRPQLLQRLPPPPTTCATTPRLLAHAVFGIGPTPCKCPVWCSRNRTTYLHRLL